MIDPRVTMLKNKEKKDQDRGKGNEGQCQAVRLDG